MDTARSHISDPKPHFVETRLGQLRVWTIGTGPALVVLPGLLKGPAQRARECAATFPGCSIVVIELPGLGGSFRFPAGEPSQAIEGAADLVQRLDQDVMLLAFDLAGPVAHQLMEQCPRIVQSAWLVKSPVRPGSSVGRLSPLQLRWDGTHLTQIWSHLRDQDMLDPLDPLRVRVDAAPYISAEELDEALLCFAQDPSSYVELWNFLTELAESESQLRECNTLADAAAVFDAAMRQGPAFSIPPSSPSEGPGITRQYVAVSRGRVHLRRAGNGPQLVMAFLAGAGSSSNLETLLDGLSDRFTVVAPDYIGQGDSCRAEEPTDVAQLATDAREIADALGFRRFCLYGTHTGAGVAIELAIAEPGRVDAVVVDGISMTPPADRAEHRALYFPEISPDIWGLHLLKAWNVRRDGGYFWPWFKPVQAFARKGAAPTLPLLHDRVMSTLRSRSTPAYQAIASYDAGARLPLLRVPTLYVAGPNDTFSAHMARAQTIAPANVRFARVPATVWMAGEDPLNVKSTLQVFARFYEAPTASHASIASY